MSETFERVLVDAVEVKKVEEPPKTPKYMEAINIFEGDSVYDITMEKKPYMSLNRFGIRGFLGAMPGCCGYGVYYNVPYREEDIKRATDVLKMILESNEDEEAGFGSIITTVADTEKSNRFQEFGWKQINEHTNPLTGNIIYTLILEL